MAQYKIAAWGRPKVPGDYTFEMDSLQGVDAEFVEVTAESDDEFLDGARDADAIVARGQSVSEKVINGLKQCKIIALDGVGTNHIDVPAATAKGILVTNCPDINIQEVAEHTAALILAAHRRLLLMDKWSVRAAGGRDIHPYVSCPDYSGRPLGLSPLEIFPGPLCH